MMCVICVIYKWSTDRIAGKVISESFKFETTIYQKKFGLPDSPQTLASTLIYESVKEQKRKQI